MYPPVTNHPNVQKHPVFQGVFPADQPGELGEFVLLQLSHEPHAAHVDPHNGDAKTAGVLGGVEDGTIPTEADQEVGVRQFGFHLLDFDGGVNLPDVVLVHRKGKTAFRVDPCGTEQGFAAFGSLQTLVPKGIGAQDNFHGSFPSNLAWDASTRAARSPV